MLRNETGSPAAKCSQLICVTDDAKTATLCFQQAKTEAEVLLADDGGRAVRQCFVRTVCSNVFSNCANENVFVDNFALVVLTKIKRTPNPWEQTPVAVFAPKSRDLAKYDGLVLKLR
jgi:hypothetical protein